MKDASYHLITGLLDMLMWGGELVGQENLPRSGPAVFIANHLDAFGPIAACCSIPLRVHPWIIANMMDKRLATDWLQEDLTERQMHLKPPVSRWLSQAICKIAVPLFYSVGCIPVYRSDYEGMQVTLSMSMDILREDKFLLVFPEDNRLPVDPLTKMQPFQHSFVRLGEVYYAETGESLKFFPVTIHASRYLVVGEPVAFNPLNPVGQERRRLKKLMEDTITAMYLQLAGGDTSGVPTPQPKQDLTQQIP